MSNQQKCGRCGEWIDAADDRTFDHDFEHRADRMTEALERIATVLGERVPRPDKALPADSLEHLLLTIQQEIDRDTESAQWRQGATHVVGRVVEWMRLGDINLWLEGMAKKEWSK